MNLTAKNALFELINSLTANEKRYITQFINKSGDKNSNHAKLFDAITKQETYDEEKLKKKFKNTSLVKQWSRVKNYLYGYTLRVLQNYHQQDAEFEAYNNIQQVIILNKKGLHGQASKLLKKTKHLALEGGGTSLLPLIAEWEMILGNLKKYDDEEKVLNYEKNNQWAVNIAHNFLQYNQACIDVLSNSATKGRHSKLETINEEILNRPMYRSIENAQSSQAKWWFYIAKIVLHAQIGQHYEAYVNARKNLELFKEYPLLQKYMPLAYFSSLNNCIQGAIDAEQWQELPFLEEEIDYYINKNKTSTNLTYLKSVRYFAVLSTYIYQGKFEAATEYVKIIEQFLLENETAHHIYIKKDSLQYVMTHVYVVNSSWEKALESIEKLEKIQNIAIYQNNILLLKLIILFEKEETLLLPYAVRVVYRSLLKKEDLFPLERMILNLLKASVKAASKDELQQIFLKYLHKIKPIVATSPRRELEILAHFDYLTWIQSKAINVPLITLLKDSENRLIIR